MDDAFCGGPDGSSLNSTEALVSDATAANVAAIVLMGDPRHVAGLAFNVGNATAAGVSISVPFSRDEVWASADDRVCRSLLPVLPGLAVLNSRTGSSRTVTLLTPFALMGAVSRRIRGTDRSMVSRRWSSS